MAAGISRRDLLKKGSLFFGGMTLSLGSAFAGLNEAEALAGPAGGSRVWYALETNRDDIDNACRRHAANKLFPTPEAADRNRAHPGCKCNVVEGGKLPEAHWVALFGRPDNIVREQADHRWDWVAKTLT